MMTSKLAQVMETSLIQETRSVCMSREDECSRVKLTDRII